MLVMLLGNVWNVQETDKYLLLIVQFLNKDSSYRFLYVGHHHNFEWLDYRWIRGSAFLDAQFTSNVHRSLDASLVVAICLNIDVISGIRGHAISIYIVFDRISKANYFISK